MTIDDDYRTIGRVTSVTSDRFIVELYQKINNFTVVGFDDMHYIARIGSFIMIPVQSEYIVAEIVGLWEKDPTANKVEKENSNELNKTLSAKYIEVVPLGVLPKKKSENFKFGVSVFPSLYTNALYALDEELDRIFEITSGEDNIAKGITKYSSLMIGHSAVFQGYNIKARINDYFGGHAAILGNTGSGKSCTVASILQSLFSKRDEYVARGATFIIFDVNGEYKQALENLSNKIDVKYLKIDSEKDDEKFILPHWFMSAEEWEILLKASEKTQRPVLRAALGLSSMFYEVQNSEKINKARNHILASCLSFILGSGDSSPAGADRINAILESFNTKEINKQSVSITSHYGKIVDPDNIQADGKLKNPSHDKVGEVLELCRKNIDNNFSMPSYIHVPFKFDILEEAISLALHYEEAHGNKQIRDFCSQMLTRFKFIKEKTEFNFLKIPDARINKESTSPERFIENFIGLKEKGDGESKTLHKESQIIILDMNDSTDEAVEVATAVIARLIFDRLRKSEPRNSLPVHLILEEAHRYITNKPPRYSLDAGYIFERIAKEGRKYGLFLHLASQRPSELSKTVLSQCSNFIVHRIQNPDDLLHIRQMTPFISDSVMKRLPSLPKQHALIFGNAVNIPTTFKVREANPRPKSDDAEIDKLWFLSEGYSVKMKP